MRKCNLTVAIAVSAVVVALPAQAQSVADFYRGKQVLVLVGFSGGAGYDLYARMLARHLGKHIPGNPTLLVQNMPGAGSLKLTNYLYSVAPKDGGVIGIVSRGMATDPLLGDSKFDPTKFNWLGSITSEVSVCATWHTSAVKTWADITTKEFTLGGSAAGAEPDTFALLLRNIFRAKMKLVTGYPGGNDINLAMERGEVDGRCGWSWNSIKSNRPTWLKEKKINLLVQLGMAKHPDLPDLPMMLNLAQTQEQRQMLG